MFYCRENELRKMNKRYGERRFECIVIYGRRRVGKTALINEFCKDKPTISFSALDTTSRENLRTLSKAIYSYKNPDGGTAPEYRTYEDALDEITELSKEKRVIFVIDEFPYLAKAEPSISSRIQHLIDHVWSEGQLFLILCGSSMSFMEYQVLGYESPLYGRRTAQFKIEPLTYRETAAFNPQLTSEENALVYGITGGIPHYINKLDVRDNLEEALLDNLFDRSSYLFEEPENLLKQELREPAVYNSIITAIAEGASRMNEIATKTGFDSGTCSKYLKVLMDLGIVWKETPVMEKVGKKSIYSVADNFFRFWYRFVPQNITAISSGRIAKNYKASIERFFPDYMGLVFEKMCRDYLIYYAGELQVDIKDIGRWWGTNSKPDSKGEHRQVEIDIVGIPVTGREYLIGSCKFRNEKTGIDELELMYEYAAAFGKGSHYHYYIFSKSGFTAALQARGERGEVTLVSLEDMYSDRGFRR